MTKLVHRNLELMLVFTFNKLILLTYENTKKYNVVYEG